METNINAVDEKSKTKINRERRALQFIDSIDDDGIIYQDGKIREQYTQKNGYAIVYLTDNYGDTLTCNAHRLIYSYFHGEIPEGKIITHKNDIKNDNHPENLEAISHRERWRRTLNKYPDFGMENGNKTNHTLLDPEIIEIRQLLAKGETQFNIAEKFGVSQSTINRIKTGKAWENVPCEK